MALVPVIEARRNDKLKAEIAGCDGQAGKPILPLIDGVA